MRLLSSAGEEAGIKAACGVFVTAIKATAAALPSKKIPPTVRSYLRTGIGYVSAGGTGGRVAPNAYMFEEYGARHPLFGNKRHWYDQPYRPFMEEGVEVSLDEAAEAFADAVQAVWEAEDHLS